MSATWRPYETRASSSTCAGRPLARRPATYFPSGGYVTIRRSRRAGSLRARYSSHRARISSGLLTAREYGADARFPSTTERGEGDGAEPDRDRRGGHRHDPAAGAVPGGRHGDEEEGRGERREQDP